MKIEINTKFDYEIIRVSRKDKSVSFVTDVSPYLMTNKLECVLGELHQQFNTTDYKIMIHGNSGIPSDKDLVIYMPLDYKGSFDDFTQELIPYIQSHFFDLSAVWK
mgnify:CR=1 FL=1|tara:strand:- start:598 stop:915 length:318 start_codon:yes stop_codon:yes gene_type:complete